MRIYTDGCCLGNPGPGGWAFLVLDNGDMRGAYLYSGGDPGTTNNRMELTAVIEAVKYARNKGEDAVIYSDSKYVVDTIKNKWYKNWKPNRPNWDLWSQLITLLETAKVNITLEYTVGHTGYNVIVDKEAKTRAQKAKEGL